MSIAIYADCVYASKITVTFLSRKAYLNHLENFILIFKETHTALQKAHHYQLLRNVFVMQLCEKYRQILL